MAQKIKQSQMANGQVLIGTAYTSAAEATYTTSVYANVGGMVASFETTKPNQQVCVISRIQTYQGGYTVFRYVLDGTTAVGDPGKYNTGVNNATTGATVIVDYFTVPTAGQHTVQLQASSGGGLRIIHAEGTGRMMVISG